MRSLTGKLLNASGEPIGSGLVLDDDGFVAEILPMVEPGEEPDGWIIPGLIDLHCHGGGGASFPDSTDPNDAMRAIMAHRSRGTTALVASLVSMVDPLPYIENLANLCDAGELAGIHLEGPYISPCKVGAQNPAAVREANLDELRTWLEAGRGHIKTMTIAPETAHAIEAAKLLLDYGAIPSWGHTDASSEQTREVITATAAYARKIGHPGLPQTATHLFNAMPPLAHREPGPVRELVAAARAGTAAVELIGDGVHVDPDLVGDVTEFVKTGPDGADGVVFVTDAMAGAGMPDGDYTLGSLDVVIKDSVARLADGGAIAGGTARLSDIVKKMVTYIRFDDVIRACVASPARVLGFTGDEVGVTLEYTLGSRPNVVVLTDEFDVTDVVREGEFVEGGE